ncbi:MAG: hypothetical protein PWP46_1059 [Fusobacteriaceae bacterium]|jgi:diguanylate cyclase (GGDEF)-like protein|nr:hypothetical protein [Fusobacteriaceae bacterium]
MKYLLVVLLFFVFFVNGFSQEKNVLVLHSYHQGLEWTDSISEGIKEKLGDYTNIKVYYEYLDTKRNYTKKYYDKLIELYKEKVYTINFDLIITADNAAFEFVINHGDSIFKDIPIIFCGVNNFDEYDISKVPIIAGVKEKVNIRSDFEAVMKMFPKRNKVYIVLDNTLTGQKLYKEIEPEIKVYKKYLDIYFIRDFVIEDLMEKISKLDDNSSVIFLLTLNRDKTGKFLSYKEAVEKISSVAKIPIFGAWDFYLKKGIIGGSLISGKIQGEKAAQISLRYLLYNEFPDRLILDTTTKYYFDYNKLKEFNVKYTPKNSIIINKPQKFKVNIKYLVYTLVVLVVSVGYLEIRVKQKEKAKKILKLEVEKRTKELEHLNAKLIKMATIDELTNIFNRRKVLGELQRLINKKSKFCIAIIDIDDFKQINDIYGHAIGDYVLKKLGEVLGQYTDEFIIPGRIGGEEFLIIFPDKNLEESKYILEDIRLKVKKINYGNYKSVTFSAGIIDVMDYEKDKILSKIDTLLYLAKNKGKDKIIDESLI